MEFLYKAYADSGEVEEGRVAAAGKREAADELRSRGLHPMTCLLYTSDAADEL